MLRVRIVCEFILAFPLCNYTVQLMLYILKNGFFKGPPDKVMNAGLKLAKFGTPDACLLAIHLANFANVTYPKKTFEMFTNACCEFKSGDSRTIEIVRGKFLWHYINEQTATTVEPL